MLTVSMAASAQVQLLYIQGFGRNVIDRNKKLYWMEGDDDPCFDILNYKKVGNKETFSLKERDGGSGVYNVELTLDPKTKNPVQATLTGNYIEKVTGAVKTTSGSEEEDAAMKKYFNGLAGNPVAETKAAPAPAKKAVAGEPEADEVDEAPAAKTTQTTEDKVKGAAKKTLGKVKGLLKKK